MNGAEWAGAITVTAVVIGFSVYFTAAAWFEHRERIAKIQMGLSPDKDPPKNPADRRAPRLDVETEIEPLLERGISAEAIERLLKPVPGAVPICVETDVVPLLDRGLSIEDIERLLKPRGTVEPQNATEPKPG